MIPDYQTCMRPVLVLLADGQTWRKRDLVAALEDPHGEVTHPRGEVLADLGHDAAGERDHLRALAHHRFGGAGARDDGRYGVAVPKPHQ